MTARLAQFLTVLVTASAICSAAETVCLKTGFCLQADSHTLRNETVALRIGSGIVEFPLAQISEIRTAAAPSPAATEVKAAPGQNTAAVLARAAEAQGLPQDFVRSVARVESGYRQNAISQKGAVGLMQLMPATAKSLGVNPELASENAQGGAMYLRSLLLRYHGDSALALAAYNAGPGAVSRFGGIPPYEETRRYVTRVLKEYARQHQRQARSTASTRLSTPSATN